MRNKFIKILSSLATPTRIGFFLCLLTYYFTYASSAMAQTAKPGDEMAGAISASGASNYGEATPIPAIDYDILIVRGALLIDGTGAPPYDPVDITIENGEITNIETNELDAGVPLSRESTSKGEKVVRKIQAQGKYVMPGLIDAHLHTDVPLHSLFGPVPSIDYVFKLWLAHGITTVRDAGSLGGLFSTPDQKEGMAAFAEKRKPKHTKY